jgi:hypothetical protein
LGGGLSATSLGSMVTLRVLSNKMFTKNNLTKISLILAFLLCLLDMPYWYYQLLRIFGTIGFIYLAYLDYKSKIKIIPQLFVACAIVINPILKISFERDTWHIVDFILAIMIIATIIFEKQIKKMSFNINGK